MKVYHLKTCETCRKTLKWLLEEGIAHDPHEVREDGLQTPQVEHIVRSLGWENAVNKRSTTWRNLSNGDKDGLDAEKAVELIVANPTLMKRPVFVTEQEVMAGFSQPVKDWLQG